MVNWKDLQLYGVTQETHDKPVTQCLCLLTVCKLEGVHFWISGVKVAGSDSRVNGLSLRAIKARRAGRRTARPTLNSGARWRLVVSANPLPIYPRERDSLPIVQEAEWTSGPISIGLERFVPTSFRTPNLPARIWSAEHNIVTSQSHKSVGGLWGFRVTWFLHS